MSRSPAIARALAFDAGGLAPAAAARAAIGVALPLVVGAATGHPADGAMAAAGALPVGVAATSATLPTAPVGLLLATTCGMAVSTFVGSLCAGHEVAVVVSLAIWGYVAGLLVTLGRDATITGVQAVVALIVFGRYPGGIATAALHASAVLAGGLLQTALALLLRPPVRRRAERAVLADLYQRLAALATGTTYGGPSGEAISNAGTLLTRRAPDDTTLRDLLDEARRIRLELQALTGVADVTGVDDLTGAAARALRDISRSVARAAAPPPERAELAAAVDALRRGAEEPGRAGVRRRSAAARAAALLGQLRAANRLAGALAGQRRLPLPRVGGRAPSLQLTGALQGNLARLREVATDRHAPAHRHAIRLGVLLPLADVLALQLPWQRGYWVPLTALVVLKPDYAATMQRGIARIIGTGLGIVLAGVLVATARPTGAALVLTVAVLAPSRCSPTRCGRPGRSRHCGRRRAGCCPPSPTTPTSSSPGSPAAATPTTRRWPRRRARLGVRGPRRRPHSTAPRPSPHVCAPTWTCRCRSSPEHAARSSPCTHCARRCRTASIRSSCPKWCRWRTTS